MLWDFPAVRPRTGSTALSQFLSEDPGARSIRRWEAAAITPPPDASVADDPRIAAAQADLARRDVALPKLKTMLPIEAEDPSEHGTFLYLSFRSAQFATLFNVPAYIDWLNATDMDCAYAYFRKALLVLQWKTPGTHWNLKHPLDLPNMPSIDRVFPDATFVWTHRDPATAMGSCASLIELLRRPTVDTLDQHALMRYLLRYQADSLRRGMQDRAYIGEERFVDLSQAQLGRDTVAAIRELYRQIGLPFSAEYEAQLVARMAARPRGRHGGHAYDFESYGLTPDRLRAPFRDYIARFEPLF